MPILKIPIEFKKVFDQDSYKAMRDIACIPIGAVHPYFPRKERLKEIIGINFKNPFDEDTLQFDEDFQYKGDNFNRYMHVDLGYAHDSTGIAMCHIPYWVAVDRENVLSGKHVKTKEEVPFIKFDFIGNIKSISGEQIVLSDISEIIKGVSRRGFFLNLITYDRFQSVGQIQELQKDNYTVGNLSLDRTVSKLIVDYTKENNIKKVSTNGQHMSAWQTLKDIIKDGTCLVPNHDQFIAQAQVAEVDYKKKKIFAYSRTVEVDGKQIKISPSLDLLEAMAGAAFNAVTNELYGNVVFNEKPTQEEELEERQEKEFYKDLGHAFDEEEIEEYGDKDFLEEYTDFDGEDIF